MSVNAFGEPLPTHQPPITKQRNTRVPLIVLGAVFLVVVLGGGCAALLFESGSKAVDGAKITANQFLNSVEKQDYDAAQKVLSVDTRNVVASKDIADVIALLQKRRGHPIGHNGPTGFYVSNTDGVTHVHLDYQERFKNGETTKVQLEIIQEEHQWKVLNFYFSL